MKQITAHDRLNFGLMVKPIQHFPFLLQDLGKETRGQDTTLESLASTTPCPHAGFNDIKILEAGSLLSKLTHIYVKKKKCVSHPFRTES